MFSVAWKSITFSYSESEMEKKVFVLVLLLTLLLIDEVMVQTEARTCYSKSKKYRGRCYLKNHISNCKTICKREKFISGRCSRGICFCFRKCADPLPPPPPSDDGEGGGGVGGGGGGGGGEGGGGDEGGEGPPSLEH